MVLSLFRKKRKEPDNDRSEGNDGSPGGIVIQDPYEQETGEPVEGKQVSHLSCGPMPVVDLDKKPSNKEFRRVKLDLVEKAFESCSDYLEFVCSLPPVKHRKDFRNLVEFMMKEFLVTFWDVPASENHHHKNDFGMVKHSFEVACLEAEQALNEVVYSSTGEQDSEKTKKMMPFLVLSRFLVGLFHDAGKIFDMDIYVEEGPIRYVYSPFKGGVLDFKLCFPKQTVVEWRKNRAKYHTRRNLFLFLNMTPRDILAKVPKDVFLRVVDDLLTYDALQTDQMSVSKDMEQQNELADIQKEIGELYKKDSAFVNIPGQSSVYKIDDNYYAVITPNFFQHLAKMCGKKDQRSVVNALIQHGMLVHNPEDRSYFCEVKVHLRPGKSAPSTMNLAFLRAEFIDKPISLVSEQKLGKSVVKIDKSYRESVQELFVGMAPPSANAFYDHHEAQRVKQERKQKLEEEKNAEMEEDEDEETIIAGTAENEETQGSTGEDIQYEHPDPPRHPGDDDSDEDKEAANSDEEARSDPAKTKSSDAPANIVRSELEKAKDSTPTPKKTTDEKGGKSGGGWGSPADRESRQKLIDFLSRLGTDYTLQRNTENNIGFYNAKGELCLLFPRTIEVILDNADWPNDQKRQANMDFLWSMKRTGLLIQDGKNLMFKGKKIVYLAKNELGGKPLVQTKVLSFFKLDARQLEESVPGFSEYINEFKELNSQMYDS